jgi:hypothetical protein
MDFTVCERCIAHFSPPDPRLADPLDVSEVA